MNSSVRAGWARRSRTNDKVLAIEVADRKNRILLSPVQWSLVGSFFRQGAKLVRPIPIMEEQAYKRWRTDRVRARRRR